MNKLADLVEMHTEELATLESLNSGKILSDSRGDVRDVLEHYTELKTVTIKFDHTASALAVSTSVENLLH